MPLETAVSTSTSNNFLQMLTGNFEIIILMGVFFYFMTSGQRKEKKQKAEMMSNLKKDQKVRTVGGLVGTIQEVQEENVVLNVDSRNDILLTFSKSAIASII